MQELDAYCQNDNFEDIPLSNELLDGFGMESYQVTTPGGLPSPNSSNPDLPGSSRQSPLTRSLSMFSGEYESQPSGGDFGTDNNPLGSYLLQQSQESRTNLGSCTSNSDPNTDQGFSNASNNTSKTHVQQGQPSMTRSSSTIGGQFQIFATPSESSLCNPNSSFESLAATLASNDSFEQPAPIGSQMSTHAPIASKLMNNTSPASVPATLQHSPASKPQHFVRNPSHLRHQIHPELQQFSPFALTATDNYTTDQLPHTMSSTHNFTNLQEPNHIDYQNIQHSSSRPPFRRITSAHSQSRGSPLLQNYQPFQESSLRTSVTSNPEQNPWAAGQIQKPQYPDPQPMFHYQSNCSPYIGHHHVLRSQRGSMISYSPEQYRMQSSDSTDFGFNGSSPMSIKRETSSSGSEHVVSTPNFKGQIASSSSQKKERGKQDPKSTDDNEVVIDPTALQTADLANLGPTDHTNVAALIDAMHNTDNVEDNLGMQKTWEKVRKAKALRIREVCVELLNSTKQAQQQKGNPLGEKRPINQYATFEERFDALCETLTFQKTVCKHLIEPSYSYVVVDDPLYARDRVKNNRRVNHQKAEAIRLGREHLGEKAQGRGKPMLKAKKRGQAQLEDSQNDEENSGDEPVSDGETDVSHHVLGPKSARSNLHASKRTKRCTDSNQNREQKGSVQASYLPQVQYLEDPFIQGLHQTAYAPIQQTQMLSEHNRILHGLAASQRLPTENQQYGFHSGNESGNLYYGDRTTSGSDSEGLGGTGYRFN
ncbi:MAG: hypothetical protein Q9161_001431 [Pseudevernia consocians]